MLIRLFTSIRMISLSLALLLITIFSGCTKDQNPVSPTPAVTYSCQFSLSQKLVTITISSNKIQSDTSILSLDSSARAMDTTSKFIHYFTDIDLTNTEPTVIWKSLSCYLPNPNLCESVTLPGYIDSTYYLVSKEESDSTISITAYDTLSLFHCYWVRHSATLTDTFWLWDSFPGRPINYSNLDHVNTALNIDSLIAWLSDSTYSFTYTHSGLEENSDTLNSIKLFKSNGVLYESDNILVELGRQNIAFFNSTSMESIVQRYSKPDTIAKYDSIKISALCSFYLKKD